MGETIRTERPLYNTRRYTDPTKDPASAGFFVEHDFITLHCRGCGETHRAQVRCKDRLCPSCRKKEFYRYYYGYKQVLRKKMKKNDRIRFLTVTLKNLPRHPLTDVIAACKKINKCFRRLRHKKAYRDKFRGGIKGLEVNYKQKTGWNVHLHIIFVGEYLLDCCRDMKNRNTAEEITEMEQTKCKACRYAVCLRRDWAAVTDGHPVLDIKPVDKVENALRYLLKYLTKVDDVGEMRDEYNFIMHRTHLIDKFGEWHGIKFAKHIFVCPLCKTPELMSAFELNQILERVMQQAHSPPDKVLVPY